MLCIPKSGKLPEFACYAFHRILKRPKKNLVQSKYIIVLNSLHIPTKKCILFLIKNPILYFFFKFLPHTFQNINCRQSPRQLFLPIQKILYCRPLPISNTPHPSKSKNQTNKLSPSYQPPTPTTADSLQIVDRNNRGGQLLPRFGSLGQIGPCAPCAL